MSLSVYLSANFAETACLNELCKIGRDDFLFGVDGFRLKNIWICPTVSHWA